MNREGQQTIAGRILPPGYSLVENPTTYHVEIFGPEGHVGSIRHRHAESIPDFADEVLKRCYEDMEARYHRLKMKAMNEPPMVSVDLAQLMPGSERDRFLKDAARKQRDALDDQILASQKGEANMGNELQQKSPAALARLRREAVRAGRMEGGHIDGSFASLFRDLDEKGLIPSRGERFGEPPITSRPANKHGPDRVHRGPMIRIRRTAKDECREIERMGALSWLLERHNDFVKDVELP